MKQRILFQEIWHMLSFQVLNNHIVRPSMTYWSEYFTAVVKLGL